ncbi:MAG: hypothetical protein JNL24_08685 [Bacteroidia bacterium]|nr:hypothetical protein [Bacteroidia bacterium]
MKKIELSHSIIVLRDDGILELHTNSEHEYAIDDVIENVETFGKLTGGKKAPVLIIGGAFTSVSKEARSFMATHESLKYSLVEAFLLNSLAQKLLINFYIKFDKPLVPTKVFNNKDEAIAWLSTFL